MKIWIVEWLNRGKWLPTSQMSLKREETRNLMARWLKSNEGRPQKVELRVSCYERRAKR